MVQKSGFHQVGSLSTMIYKVLAPSNRWLGPLQFLLRINSCTPGLSCRVSLIPSVKMRRHFVWLEWRATSFKYLGSRLGSYRGWKGVLDTGRHTRNEKLPESQHINSGGSVVSLPKDSGIKESMGTGLLLTCVNI